jgi:hypothetical protein
MRIWEALVYGELSQTVKLGKRRMLTSILQKLCFLYREDRAQWKQSSYCSRTQRCVQDPEKERRRDDETNQQRWAESVKWGENLPDRSRACSGTGLQRRLEELQKGQGGTGKSRWERWILREQGAKANQGAWTLSPGNGNHEKVWGQEVWHILRFVRRMTLDPIYIVGYRDWKVGGGHTSLCFERSLWVSEWHGRQIPESTLFSSLH